MPNTPNDVHAEITRGAFQNQYLIYSRKSTDEADNQKNSISYQGKENLRFAERDAYQIAPVTICGFCSDGIIAEKHSGFKETDALKILDDGTVQYQIDRPKFQQLLQHLNKGHFKGVICLCWDRLSRNRGDDTIIRKLMKRGVDVRFVYVNYDQSSAGELHMDIDGMFAQHHSRVTSEKIKLAVKSKREEGKCTYRAPIGYLNEGNIDHKPFDPERAPIIKELFQLCATGTWSISDLTAHANAQGLTGSPFRSPRSKREILEDDGDTSTLKPKTCRPMQINRIHAILSNRFYTGRVIGPDGVYIQSTSHDALVDDTTFAKVQASLGKRKVSIRYAETVDHPYRGFVRCAGCRRVYTPYEQKGNVYYGSHCTKDCTNTLKSVNETRIDGHIRDMLSDLQFTDDELIELDARADTEVAVLEQHRRQEEDQADRKRKKIKDDLSYLRSNQLTLLQTGVFTPEALTDERMALEAKLAELDAKNAVSETAMRDLAEQVVKVSELLKSVVLLYETANSAEKELLAKTLVSELLLDQNTVIFRPQIGFEPIFERKVLLCEPSKRLSELCNISIKIANALRHVRDSIVMNKKSKEGD
jgi:DNA invertase Pin-like site-specific DNA recombinase